ncbi:MAG TPA: hypothetical protein VFB66_23785 [Tepidisphaeraceae bacterium]|nr:hypothetical protein [Tepidisphaeraceae bacterium]
MPTHRSPVAAPSEAPASRASLPDPLVGLESELDRLCDAIARGLASMYRRRQAALVPFHSGDRADLPRVA